MTPGSYTLRTMALSMSARIKQGHYANLPAESRLLLIQHSIALLAEADRVADLEAAQRTPSRREVKSNPATLLGFPLRLRALIRAVEADRASSSSQSMHDRKEPVA